MKPALAKLLLEWSRSNYDPQEEPEHPPAPERPRPGAVIRGETHLYELDWGRTERGAIFTLPRCSCGRWVAPLPGGESLPAFAQHLQAVRAGR